MNNRLYEIWEVKQILNLSQLSVSKWIEKDLIVPVKKLGDSKKKCNKYSYINIIEIKIIHELTEIKIPFPKIQKVLKAIFPDRNISKLPRKVIFSISQNISMTIDVNRIKKEIEKQLESSLQKKTDE